MFDITVEHVSKRYMIRPKINYLHRRHFDRLTKIVNSHDLQEFWALRDVSFEVRRGEAFGIIGRNGAGKSTILKLLSRITTPTHGIITLKARLSALIEVRSGFHPELTGRENIYFNGSIIGMKRREITRKLDSIIDFSGLSQFIDVPVKRYSSGMYVRLGFSVAAHLDAGILLLDEVLAVGDASFQVKCLQRIRDLGSAGKTIVFISHDLDTVRRLCRRVLLVEQGRVVADGPTEDVITQYTRGVAGAVSEASIGLSFVNRARNSDAPFEIENVEILDRDGLLKKSLRTGDYVRFRIRWRSAKFVKHGEIELGVHTLSSVPLIHCSNQPSGVDLSYRVGLNTADLEFPEFPLAAGEYYLSIGLRRPLGESLHRNDEYAVLTVQPRDVFGSGFPLNQSRAAVAVPHRWVSGEGCGDNASGPMRIPGLSSFHSDKLS